MAGLFENLPYANFHELNLGWLVAKVKELSDLYDDLDLDGIFADIRAAIAGNTAAIASLNNRFAVLENGGYIENYIAALGTWIDNNLIELVSRIAVFAQFGLTNNGYFYVDIPESWDMITFSTGYDVNDPETYLHLMLNY